MGVWEFLTKERGIGSAAFRWNEPSLYRIRLRSDLFTRLAIIAAAWLGATGILLVLFAFNQDPPGVWLAFGLGIVFGLGPAMLLTMLGRNHVAGRIRLDDEGVHRQRTYASFSSQWSEWTDWPYEAIRRCEIVPPRVVGQVFALMLLSIDEETDVIAVPPRIELKQLAGYLSKQGVAVSTGKAVPRRYLAPLNVMTAVVMAGVAAVLFAGGLTTYLMKT